MIELNVKFQEKYKQLDVLCKEIFKSNDGISKYIYEMETVFPKYSTYVPNWHYVYKQLKHLRWVRNQLAHEIGTFETDLCTVEDIKWINDFYNSILSTTDPLAIVGKNLRAQQKPYNKNLTQESKIYGSLKQNISLWTKIKKWFS